MNLIDQAEAVLLGHGWTTHREAEMSSAGFEFDLVAENETAIVFLETVAASALQRKAETLSAAVATVTLQRAAGVKAWEAYLVLIVTDRYEEVDHEAQRLQRNLDYCRKVVLDGSRIAATVDHAAAMEAALAFLFPLELEAAPGVENVRSRLIELLVGRGFDAALVDSLVNEFDSEPKCTCLAQVSQFVAETPQP